VGDQTRTSASRGPAGEIRGEWRAARTGLKGPSTRRQENEGTEK
jgi:hypothetical protein